MVVAPMDRTGPQNASSCAVDLAARPHWRPHVVAAALVVASVVALVASWNVKGAAVVQIF
jgi:hypothetical protein